VNGKLPEMFYERRTINTDAPLAEIMARSDVTDVAKAAEHGRRIEALTPSSAR